MPSFAEGYGLPVVEALAMGVPVICSDIEAHREVGKGTPEFLDPLDGIVWMQKIIEYSESGGEGRTMQLTRLVQWPIPSWNAHIATVLDFVARINPRRPVCCSYWSRRMLTSSVNIQST